MGLTHLSFHVLKLKIKRKNVAVIKKKKANAKKIQSTHLQWS